MAKKVSKKAYALERAQNAGIKTKIVSPFAVLGEQKAKTVSKEEKRIAVSDAALNAQVPIQEICHPFKEPFNIAFNGCQ